MAIAEFNLEINFFLQMTFKTYKKFNIIKL